jgi:hypothetical protein
LNRLDSLVYICEFHVTLIAASGYLFDRSFEDLLGLLFVLGSFEQIGIAHGEYFIVGILIVGEGVEVLGLFVIKGLILFLCHLEERLEGQLLKGFDRHQQQSTMYNKNNQLTNLSI